LSQRVATCLPAGVCCCGRLSFSCHINGPLLCFIRQTAQKQALSEPTIHPPWCDCFCLGADSIVSSTIFIPSNRAELLSIHVCSGHSRWFHFHLRLGSLTLTTGWLKLWGTVGFPIPQGDSSMCLFPVMQSTSHVSNEVPLFLIKTSLIHVPLSLQHTCAFWKASQRSDAKGPSGSVSFHRNQPSCNCVSH